MPYYANIRHDRTNAMNSLHSSFASLRNCRAVFPSHRENVAVTTLWTNAVALVDHPSEAPPA